MLTNHTIPQERLRALGSRPIPGVAVVVVGPEGVRAIGAAGWADLTARVPMSTEVAVPWFSMTKIATATLAVRLAEDGTIDLDEPIAAVADEVSCLQPTAWARRITRRHLLQHTAGLANPLPLRWIHPQCEPACDQDQLLESLLGRHGRLRSEPDTRVAYSNLGTLLLTASLVRPTGVPFAELMRRHVLDPLSMRATAFGHPPGATAATGYHPRLNPLRLALPRWVVGPSTGRWTSLRPFAVDGLGYGGLVGTAEDAARLLQLHLADGEVDHVRILGVQSTTAMRSIDRCGGKYDLGLGWFRARKDRHADPVFVEHLGGGAGFHTLMRLYPAERVGAVVMGNATSFDAAGMARLALEYR